MDDPPLLNLGLNVEEYREAHTRFQVDLDMASGWW